MSGRGEAEAAYGRGLGALGRHLFRLADDERAAAVAGFGAAGDAAAQARAAAWLARVRTQQGELALAAAPLEEALTAARRAGDAEALAFALEVGADRDAAAGHWQHAWDAWEQARQLYEATGQPDGVLRCAAGLGEGWTALGDLDAAEAWLSERSDAFEATADREVAGRGIGAIAVLRGAGGHAAETATLCRMAFVQLMQTVVPGVAGRIAMGAGRGLVADGSLTEGAAVMLRGIQVFTRLEDRRSRVEAGLELARAYAQAGWYPHAEEVLADVLDAADAVADLPALARALEAGIVVAGKLWQGTVVVERLIAVARIYQALDQPERRRASLAEALALANERRLPAAVAAATELADALWSARVDTMDRVEFIHLCADIARGGALDAGRQLLEARVAADLGAGRDRDAAYFLAAAAELADEAGDPVAADRLFGQAIAIAIERTLPQLEHWNERRSEVLRRSP